MIAVWFLDRMFRDNFSETTTLNTEMNVRGLAMSVSGEEQPWQGQQLVQRP